MGDDDRVVLRSPWRADVLNVAPIAVAFIVIAAWGGGAKASVVTVLIVFAVMTTFFHFQTHAVLTGRGIELGSRRPPRRPSDEHRESRVHPRSLYSSSSRRPMIIFWMSEVPSPISSIGASR
jgi:hypothetical protein